jgi:spore coat polysaccharide biosynthesis predicted glycosyltransferase SpsG
MTPEQQQAIIDLVSTILAQKKADPTADTSIEENEIDRLVYDLYGINETERKLIEQK